MLVFVLATLAMPLAASVLWWALLRQTRTVFPHALTETVESEAFREWLGNEAGWLLWGRDEQGRYYATTLGSLAARRMRAKAQALHAALASTPSPRPGPDRTP